MKIETKFKRGDAVFFIHDKKVCNSVVRGIKIEVEGIETTITYLCNKEEENKIRLRVDEKDAFPSKEELLKSL